MFYSSNLKKINQIRHCFFSRKNGNSLGIYKSLNCGKGSKDKKIFIKKNLNLVSKKMNIKRKLFLMYQTHSNKVMIITNKNKNLNKFKSDAIVTQLRGYGLGVVTADCVPIVLYDKKNHTIGCIHAGWKGALSGIVENTIKTFKKISLNNEIFAAVGPCIDKKSYEVDSNFYKKFILRSKKNKIYFLKKNKNKKLFDLRGYVTHKLLKLNINVDHINLDTFKQKSNFFSYRRSQKKGETDYGRCVSVISLTNFGQN